VKLRALILPALLALLSAAPVPSPAADAVSSARASRVIVKWRTGGAGNAATPERIDSLIRDTTRRVARGWNIGGSLSVVQLDTPQSGRELATTLAALRANPDIELAVPDERVRSHYLPNDPLYADGFVHAGQLYDYQWYLKSTLPAAIRAEGAWDLSRGGTSAADSTVIVAVLDSGVRRDHPDLAGKLLPGWDFVSSAAVGNDGDGWDSDPSDPGDYISAEDLQHPDFADGECGGGTNRDQPLESSWHGTRVAGLIAAASDNGVGMTGSGFHVRVLPVRVLGKCGGFVSDVIAGMYWAAGLAPPPPLMQSPIPPRNTTPARVLNLSLGSERACTEELSEVYRIAVEQVTAAGTLVVASSGNSGAAVGTPAGCNGVLGVAGIRHVGTKVGYSNLGPEVGISAPAGNCLLVGSADPCLYALNTLTNLGTLGPEENGYASPIVQPTIGTSFSAPLVSGTAALMFAANPQLTPAQAIALIRVTARPFPAISDTMPQPPACALPSVTPLQPSECICNTQVCGAGMLDASAAVQAALGAPAPPATEEPDGGGGSGGAPLCALLAGLLIARRVLRRRAPLLH
jgi:serine protease